MNDSDDLVQKGYGWVLKDASYYHKKEVIKFLLKHKKMPRTALRYACERLTKGEKEKIMY
jgi:3-methyladenine DNA glycosylase AlkD